MKSNWANYPALIKRSRGAGITGITTGIIGLILMFISATEAWGIAICIFALLILAYAHGLKDADSIIYRSLRNVNKE